MEFLIFPGVIIGGIAAFLLVMRAMSPRGPKINVVLIASAAGSAEVDLWMSALRRARIWARLQNVGDIAMHGTAPYAYEVWVREEDAEAARRAIGLQTERH